MLFARRSRNHGSRMAQGDRILKRRQLCLCQLQDKRSVLKSCCFFSVFCLLIFFTFSLLGSSDASKYSIVVVLPFVVLVVVSGFCAVTCATKLLTTTNAAEGRRTIASVLILGSSLHNSRAMVETK